MNLISTLRLTSFYCAALLTLASAHSACAAEATSFPAVVVDDVATVFTAPARWETQDWKTAGWATLAVVGVAVVADRPVRDFMCKQSKISSCPEAGPNAEVKNSALTTIENFGQTYALGVMGGFYLAGVISDNEKSVQVSQDLVAASLSSALVNQSIKIFANRSRPRDNQGTDDFKGFTGLNNNSSFPSGHTTEAFTLASVIASHYEETWVGATAYSVAGLVGVARMYHDAHFASDVVASALIGTFVGKSIVKHNRTLRTGKVALLPMIGPDFAGVQVVGNF
ncbi:MAG: phosphoesterase PA-phosphatase related [Gallionellaceae bacterium]|nr:MAG: phosphoesterase PA-phosphatase related [Gallionellaceae bacterium]